MKKPQPRTLIVFVYFALLVLLIVSGSRLVRCRKAAAAAAANLADCSQLVRRIEKLQSTPTQASFERRSLQDFALKIQQAAQIAKAPDSAIIRIDPQPSRRVDETPYLQQGVSVSIRQVPLEGLTTFLCEVAASESDLQASSIRLTAPRTPPKEGQAETWSAEVTLTHLVFSPE